jgi:transcriptional regulator with XRE-family HTH domain
MKDYITQKELAERIGVAPQMIARWLRQGIGPQPKKVHPRFYLYEKDEAETFIALYKKYEELRNTIGFKRNR